MIRPARRYHGLSARPRGALVHALWAGSGFLAGIAFWHLVGFWTLVSTAVLGVEDLALEARSEESAFRNGAPVETGSVRRAVSAGCVTLILNRASGTTGAGPCPSNAFHLRNGESAGKGNHG